MSTMPLPDKGTTNRELLTCARKIERYGAQRRKLLARVDELEGRIREAKRMFRALTDLIASPDVLPSSRMCCPFHAAGGSVADPCAEVAPSQLTDGAR